VPDPIFADQRLAALYDIVDDDRRDLDVYAVVSFRHVFRFDGVRAARLERRPMTGAERGGERADMAPCAGR